MKPHRTLPFLIVLILPWFVFAADDYVIGPDSTTQPDVPHGEILHFVFNQSKIFPGTAHDCSVYVPAQYKPDTPACVYVGQDGIGFHANTVFDNLISKKEMPITIGVFIKPGIVASADKEADLDRFNRSYEYDGLGDNYAKFLVDEILPQVETMKASDGREIHLSHNGNDRAIGGASSGAICAFTVAWERPDQFSRVFSAIGTFVGLRGGDRYPILIRKTEPKPLRIFLQDGSNDHNHYGGDWWMANQTMERAFTFAGYEVNHTWGDGGHTHKQGDAIFPDVMRWLWKDWPQPVKAGVSGNQMLADILDTQSQSWQLVGEGYQGTDGPAVNAKGEVFFNDRAGKTHKVALDGSISVFLEDSKKGGGESFGPDGKLYALARGVNKLVAYDADGSSKDITDGINNANDLCVAHNGNIYVTEDPAKGTDEPSKVWLVKPDGSKQVVDTGLKFANGITLSPDQSLLYVDDYRSHWVYSFQIQADGTLADKQQYYWLHEPDTADDAGPDGMCVDRDGRLYIATRMGIQVADQAGRVNCIIPTPNGRISNLCFGGENFNTLFATCGDKVYKRQFKITGNPTWNEPHKPAPPKL